MKKTLLLFAALFFVSGACFSRQKKEDPYSDKKLHPIERTGLQKFLGTNRYDVLEECSVFVKTLTGSMKAKKGSFIYRRGTDIAGFRLYYDTTAYALQMAKEARETCIAAIDRYFSDFESKSLNRSLSAKKSRRLYGQAGAYIDYGVAIDMMNYKAKPNATFGYVFVKGNPYFVIHLDKAKNLTLEGKSSSDYGNLETIVVNFYFTRKQAQALKDFISNQNVNELMANYDYKEIEADAQNDADEYNEQEEYNEAGDFEEDYEERDDFTKIKM